MKQRTDKLLAAMPGGFEAALVSTDVNRFYFLGFDSGDAGTVLILPDKTYFIIDSRYIEIAEATVKEAEVILEGKALEQVRDILAAHGVKHLYLENKATLAYADRVRAALPGVEVDTGAVLSDAIDAIRAVKSEEEFARHPPRARSSPTPASSTCWATSSPACGKSTPRWDGSVYEEPRRGQAGVRHDLCLGGKTSLPHGVPGDKRIEAGDFVTMDFGANVDGYCTDMTRTVAVGHVSDEQKKVYDTGF